MEPRALRAADWLGRRPDAKQSVCVWISEGIPHSPALSGSSTAPLEECCSQEGRATSTALIFYRQGGFIGLINWLFVCAVCMREEERAGVYYCVLFYTNVCV